ncbi:transposase [Lacticaseibacillus paracasei]|uniref:transposase n=2 Tax=Lacticaseibacillus paracasei TaxID=1597 RepID=UPI001F02197C|nr:transposase [Lacticaseibacillus paracasei]
MAHYSLAERTRVQTVTMDMNAAYQTIIHEVFPKTQVVIDRFHIIQLAARALDQVRVQALKQGKVVTQYTGHQEQQIDKVLAGGKAGEH